MVLTWPSFLKLSILFEQAAPDFQAAGVTQEEVLEYVAWSPRSQRKLVDVYNRRLLDPPPLDILDTLTAQLRSTAISTSSHLRQYLKYLRSVAQLPGYLVVSHGWYESSPATQVCPPNVVVYELARPGRFLTLPQLGIFSKTMKTAGGVEKFLSSPSKPYLPGLPTLEKLLILPGEQYRDKNLTFDDPSLIMGIFALPLAPDFTPGTVANTMQGLETSAKYSLIGRGLMETSDPYRRIQGYLPLSYIVHEMSTKGGGALVLFSCRAVSDLKTYQNVSTSDLQRINAHSNYLALGVAHVVRLNSQSRPTGTYETVRLPQEDQETLRMAVLRGKGQAMARGGSVYHYIGTGKDGSHAVRVNDALVVFNDMGTALDSERLHGVLRMLFGKRGMPANGFNAEKSPKRAKKYS
jgi:hypothetical protein